jgi:PhnB protein
MTIEVNPIPQGFHTVTPYLCVRDAAQAIEFYQKAFGAREVMRLAEPSGRIGHAEIRIGDSPVMLADEFPEMGILGPQSLGGSPVRINLFVEDVDALVNQAVAVGATVQRPVANQFYGERSGILEDPFGHIWLISTHIEEVSPEEMQQRYDDLMKQKVPA